MLVILGESPERAQRYGTALHAPFPILADPTLAVYHLFGLEKSFLVMQRTASVVVDRTGMIRYIRRATNPITWLQESRELLQTVQRLAGE